MIQVYENKFWDNKKPFITVITPVYNRDIELLRAMTSVKKQDFNNFEYIIVNDGSTIDIDNMVFDFLNSVDFPVLYLKKENGGVHTARNLAIKYARGELVNSLDSDDELLPYSLSTIAKIWNKFSANEKRSYREICARCSDQNNKELGPTFPKNINSLSWKKARRLSYKGTRDHVGFWRTDTLKNNPWPEPEGITFVGESIIWKKLEKTYKSYFINDILLKVHLENSSSISRNKTKSIQILKNMMWNKAYMLNFWKKDKYFGLRNYLECILFYTISKILLKKKKVQIENNNLKRFPDKLMVIIFFVPSLLLSHKYY